MPRRRRKPKIELMQEIGHNHHPKVKEFVKRVEEIHRQQAELRDDERQLMIEIRGESFEPRLVRKLVRFRRDPTKFRQEIDYLESYAAATGDWITTPLASATKAKS